ncbi:MAG: TetR family transcriptional regulator [Pararhizobium sp.]
MNEERMPARERILSAAAEVAKELGPARLSLEAVAARAGVSKGGLLYHFPSKGKLMEALVEHHVAMLSRTIAQACTGDGNRRNCLARAYVTAFDGECGGASPPSTGVLAAVAENPEFLDPIRRFQDEIVKRFRTECDDPVPAITAFLAVQGIRSLDLFDCNVLTADERRAVLEYLKTLL